MINSEEILLKGIGLWQLFYSPYAIDYFAGNDWSNRYWRGTEITHLP